VEKKEKKLEKKIIREKNSSTEWKGKREDPCTSVREIR